MSTRFKKVLIVAITVIIVPLVIALIANYTTWFSTKDTVELTLKLDGWITVGSVKDSTLAKLKLTYDEKPINSILKVSWLVINTGTKGISGFEKGPFIAYPPTYNVVEAIVTPSETLNINNRPWVDSARSAINFNDLGIFNPHEYFKLDVYMIDVPDTLVTLDYLGKWSLVAKAIDLVVKTEISGGRAKVASDTMGTLVVLCLTVIMAIISFSSLRLASRAIRLSHRSLEMQSAELKDLTANLSGRINRAVTLGENQGKKIRDKNRLERR